ncbi:crossover junction endodeoxyribonuclease RuvC [Candidatus Zixiibacteriota bacterium]
MNHSRPELTILGIDPGSHQTGWGLIGVSGNELRAVDHGLIRLSKKEPLSTRLLILHQELTAIIERVRPDEAAVESVYMAKNAKSALILGHARGVILLACAGGGVIPAEYPANTIKQAVLGQGGAAATKERVAFMVRAILGLDEIPEPADITDALACAICHAHRREVPR